jgi:hypothetical protein
VILSIHKRNLAYLITGNTVFEPGKEGSHYKGSGSGSGDKEEEKKTENKDTQKGGDNKG